MAAVWDMATLQDPTFGKLAFDYTDEERLLVEVRNVTINTGNSNQDFLSHVPEHV